MTDEERAEELRRKIRDVAPHVGATTYADASELLHLEGVAPREEWQSTRKGPPYPKHKLDEKIREVRGGSH